MNVTFVFVWRTTPIRAPLVWGLIYFAGIPQLGIQPKKDVGLP